MNQNQMSKDQSESNNTEEFEEIQIFLDQAHKQSSLPQQLLNLENKAIIFLLGNTKVGKSTLFHLLQGDKLKQQKKYLTLSNEGIENLIGHMGLSFTKKINVFTQKESEVIIIDTPGFYDTNDGYDEVISQINLAKILNWCKQEKCKDIIFLVVARYDEFNYNQLQETLIRIEENFGLNIDPTFLKKISLIVSKCDSDREEMSDSMQKIFNRILQSNNRLQQNQIIKHLQVNKEQILYFPEFADEKQQQILFEEIQDFIKKALNEVINLDKLKFFMTISDKGFIKIRFFLEKFLQFYLKEISSAYEFLFAQINQMDDLGQQFRICMQIQNIQEDPLYFNNIQRFLKNFNNVQERFNLKVKSQYRIQMLEELFNDKWIETIFEFESQKRYFNHNLSLQMQHNYSKITNLLRENYQKQKYTQNNQTNM